MARKPNYRFERMERQRQKQAKKEERAKVKQERAATRLPGDETGEEATGETGVEVTESAEGDSPPED